MDLKNSMLLANMMSQNKIMYATIKGTLTENDGVFSGFAYNKYLVTQEEFDYSKDYEIVLKTNTGDLSLTSYKVIIRSNSGSNPGASGWAIGIEKTRLRSYIINSEGGYIANGSFGVSSFVNDADYFFKFSQKIDNGIYTIKLETSTDGINWTTENSWTSSLPIRNSGQGIAFGGGGFSSTSQYWAGSIDLNRSYIKLGSTKYNLQAVVGYTIVGSPTITDGVVSGFTNSNYLSLPTNNILHNANAWEIIIKLEDLQSGYFLGSYTQYSIALNKSKIYLSSNRSSWDIASGVGTGSANNDSYVRIKFTGSSYIYDYSSDEINWTNIATINSSVKIVNIAELQIGKWYGYSATGSINIAKSQVKINNKLWFNGQQA